MRGKLNGSTDATAPDDGTSGLCGRRVLSWCNWGTYGAGVYDRGVGEGIWRSEQHRLVLSLTPSEPLLMQIDGGSTQHMKPDVGFVSFYPAGSTTRTTGTNSRFAHVCWNPGLYEAIAPDLTRLPQARPELTFPDPLISQLMRTLAGEIRNGDVDRLLADSLLTALAMRMAQRVETATLRYTPDLPRSRIGRVLDYIEAHLEADLTLTELAGVACLSPSHFSRAFKEAVGTGPHRYTVQRRIERAKDLLRRSGDSLAEVAAATGFTDQSHLTLVFRREVGVTPGRFRVESGKTAIPS